MAILKKKKRIIIEENRQGQYTVNPIGFENCGEVCDVLLGVLCGSIKIVADSNATTLSVIKQLYVNEISTIELEEQNHDK